MKTLVTLCLLLAACGGAPSSQSICHNACDKQGSCVNAPSTSVDTCKSGCDANKANWDDIDKLISMNCSSPDDTRNKLNDCYTGYCDSSLATQCANETLAPCGLTITAQ